MDQGMRSLDAEDVRPDIAYMLEQAVKAPSGHNAQPWLFRVGDDWVQILPDTSKSLPVVDPDNRELFIGLGCAVENLCVAARARGYDVELDFSKAGEITVGMLRGQVDEESVRQLRWLSERQTNRSVYTGERISPEVLAYLREIPLEKFMGLRLWARDEEAFSQVASYIYEGNERQLGDPLFKRELHTWMRFNKRHERAMSDGLSYAVFGAPNLPRFLSEPVMTGVLRSDWQSQGDRKRLESASHIAIFTLQKKGITEWIGLGRSLQRFLLRVAACGCACSFLNQPCEVSDLASGLADALSLEGESVELILRLGYAKRRMPYSPRVPWREKLV